MKIRYKLEYKDYLDFNINYLESSPRIKRNMMLQRILIPAILIGVPLISPNKSNLWLFVLIGAAFFLFHPRFIKWRIAQRVKRTLRSPAYKNRLDDRELEIDDKKLYFTGANLNIELEWSEIKKFEDTPSQFLLYTNTDASYIVPKRAFSSKSEENEFINIVKTHVKG